MIQLLSYNRADFRAKQISVFKVAFEQAGIGQVMKYILPIFSQIWRLMIVNRHLVSSTWHQTHQSYLRLDILPGVQM